MMKAKGETKKKKSGLKKALADSDTEMLNLEKELHSLTHYADDEEELVAQMFSSIKGTKLDAMLPPILKEIPLIDLQQLCLHELRGMSQRRILSIINGQEMSGSSSEEDSDVPVRDKQEKKIQDVNEDSNMTERSTKSIKEEVLQQDDNKPDLNEDLNNADNVNEANLTALDILELELRAKLIKTMLEKQPSGDERGEEDGLESPSGALLSNFVPPIKIKEEPLSPPEPMFKGREAPEPSGKRRLKKKYARTRGRSSSRSYSSSSSSSSSRSSSSSSSSSRSSSRRSSSRSKSPASGEKTTSKKDKYEESESNSESKKKPVKKKITKKEFEARMKKAKLNRSYRKRKDSEDDSDRSEKKRKRGRSKKKVDPKKPLKSSSKTTVVAETAPTKSTFNLKEILKENNIIPSTPAEAPEAGEIEEGEEGEILEKEEGEIDSNEEEGACSASDQSTTKKGRDKTRSWTRSRSRSYYSSRSCSSYSSRSGSYSRSPKSKHRTSRSSKHGRKKSYSKSGSTTPSGPKVPNWQSRSKAKGRGKDKPPVEDPHKKTRSKESKDGETGMELVNSEEDFDEDSKSGKINLPTKPERQSISFSIGKKTTTIKPNPDLQDDGVPIQQSVQNVTTAAAVDSIIILDEVSAESQTEEVLPIPVVAIEQEPKTTRKGMKVNKQKRRPHIDISKAVEKVDLELKTKQRSIQAASAEKYRPTSYSDNVKNLEMPVVSEADAVGYDEPAVNQVRLQEAKINKKLEPLPELSQKQAKDGRKNDVNELEPGEVEDFYKGADQLSFSDDNSGEVAGEDEADLETFLHDDTPVEPIHIEAGMLRKSVKVVTKIEDEPPLVSWQSKDRKKKDRTKGALVMDGVGFLKTVLSESQTTAAGREDDLDEDDSLMEEVTDGEFTETQDILDPIADADELNAMESHKMNIIGVIDPKADREADPFDEELIGGSNWNMRWLQSEKVQKVVSNSKMLSKVRKSIQAKGKNITKEKAKEALETQHHQQVVVTPIIESKSEVVKLQDKSIKSSQPVVGSIEEYENLYNIKVKAPLSLPQSKPPRTVKAPPAASAPPPKAPKPLSSLLDSDDSEDDEEAALWSKIMKK